jgi:hypothetical protein
MHIQPQRNLVESPSFDDNMKIGTTSEPRRDEASKISRTRCRPTLSLRNLSAWSRRVRNGRVPVQTRQQPVHGPQVPKAGCIVSIHVLVNRERIAHGIPPMYRSSFLDDLARQQAATLAAAGRLEPSPRTRLAAQLQSQAVAENVCRGATVQDMHCQCMILLPQHGLRILSPRYNEMGMGTATSPDDNNTLYMVQYFRYNENIKLEPPGRPDIYETEV